jgi:hypothetical protein
MSAAYITIGFVVLVWGSIAWLARGVIVGLSKQAAENVKNYAPAYAKGGVLILVAALTTFVETFEKLSSDVAAVLPWWSWLCLLCKPVIVAGTTYVAFMDRTVERIRNSNPPFRQ